MGYELHIKRNIENEDGLDLISTECWKLAVTGTAGLRLFTKRYHRAFLPSGEVMRMRAREGDTEVWFPEEQVWRFVFRWWGGRVSFQSRAVQLVDSDPVWRAAKTLAARLNAEIRGDEGEGYWP